MSDGLTGDVLDVARWAVGREAMNGTLQTALGTGPFFGHETRWAKQRRAENMDLSPSRQRRGQSHFHGGRPGILSQRRWRRENWDSPRSGLTLVELLVVLGIMLTLTVIAAPALRPAIEGRRAREAARGLSVYLGGARARAMETGRPAGVIFERFSTARNQACTVIRPAEVPPLYGGDTTDTAITMQTSSTGTYSTYTTCTVLANTASGSVTPSLFSLGDMLQVNYQGPWYSIAATSGSGMTLTGTGFIPPWSTSTTAALPFQICRQPTPSAGPSFQMPIGTAIDVVYSGMGDTGQFDSGGSEPASTQNSPVTVIFSPNGSVSAVYYRNNTCVPYPSDTIYFLVGRMDRIPTSRSVTTTPNPDSKDNLTDPANFWVAINPRTGLITTAEMYYDSSMTATASSARTYARQFLSAGGR